MVTQERNKVVSSRGIRKCLSYLRYRSIQWALMAQTATGANCSFEVIVA